MEFLKINNRNNFLLKEIPTINPASKKYIKFWEEQTIRCIDGFWSIDEANVNVDIILEKPEFPESKSWRYMPPGCYFYVNFGTIQVNKKGSSSGAKVPSRPNLDDVEWEYTYILMEARGFSGFEFDTEYSCNRKLTEGYSDDELIQMCIDESGERIDYLYDNYFKKNGERKTYIEARKYIRQTFEKPLGRPTYANVPKNFSLLGTRDGGKSWLTAGCVISHEILFDGIRRYEKGGKIPIAEVVVGAGLSDKSKDLLKKTVFIFENLPGKYNKGSRNEIPSPFYKSMSGSIGANKEYFHLYKKKVGGEMKDVGTGAIIKHRVFTSENPEAAAGGRPGTIIVEEQGLCGNLIAVHGGNDAAQNDGGIKFGSSIYIGTAGNVDKIQDAEKIFKNPSAFDMLEFDNIWEPENTDKIGWFIPAPYMSRKYKDSNGNTMIKEAYAAFEKRRLKAENSPSRRSGEIERMNYPLVPSEMFVNAEANVFAPIIGEVKRHYSRLVGNKKLLESSYKVEFYIREDTGKVDFANVKKIPIRDFPLIKRENQYIDISGCPEIFQLPYKDEMGVVPSGVYIAGYDPVDDDDNTDTQRSLQSFWIASRLTNEIVFEYTGRTEFAEDFYKQCRYALLYYNAICNYENNKKGFYGYMFKEASTHMLMGTPEILLQKDMQKSRGVGNKSLGTNANTDVISWGLELILNWLNTKVKSDGEETNLKILHTIKSPALLKEIMSFKPKGNFDRISALIVLMIALEDKRKFVTKAKKRVKTALDDEFFNRFRDYNSMPDYLMD